MAYFKFESTEDGIYIQEFPTWAAAKNSLDPDGKFLSKVPACDKGCFVAPEGAVLLIRGDVVVPKPRSIVTELEEPR